MLALQQFERVLVQTPERVNDHHGFPFGRPPTPLLGKIGTVIWIDREANPRGEPVYLVEVDLGRGPVWVSARAGSLTSTGEFEDPSRWHGARHEVSFDTVPGGQEGCLRRPGTFWECFFFAHRPVQHTTCETSRWQSGIVGHLFTAPLDADIDSHFVIDAMERLLGMKPIHLVRGPDSLSLK